MYTYFLQNIFNKYHIVDLREEPIVCARLPRPTLVMDKRGRRLFLANAPPRHHPHNILNTFGRQMRDAQACSEHTQNKMVITTEKMAVCNKLRPPPRQNSALLS